MGSEPLVAAAAAARIVHERTTRGWTQLAASGRLAACFEPQHRPDVDVVHRRWKDWEAGRHKPGRDYAPRLCELFGLAPQVLFTSPAHADDTGDDDMHRRNFLALGAGAALPLPIAEDVRAGLARSAGMDSLDDWRAMVDDYAERGPVTAPAVLLAELLTDLAEIRLLLETGFPDRAGLHQVAAALAAFSAQTTYDSGSPGAAFRWWRTAQALADRSGHAPSRAWIRARHGADLLFGRRSHDRALQLADEAIAIADGPCAGLAQAHQLRVNTLADRVDPRTREATDALSRVVDGLPEGMFCDHTVWSGYSQATLHGVKANALMALGDPQAARQQITKAIELTPPHYHGAVAGLELKRARCMLLDGDLPDGIVHAVDTLANCRDLWLSTRDEAGRLLDMVPTGQRRLPKARELVELTRG